MVFETEITIPPYNISARVIHCEQALLKETTDFVKDHKSLIKKANESLEHIQVLENFNDSLMEDVMSTYIMSIIMLFYSVEDVERLKAETSKDHFLLSCF